MAVKLTHRLNGSKITVADDDAAKFWTERGYVADSGSSKPTAKKATAKRSSSKSK